MILVIMQNIFLSNAVLAINVGANDIAGNYMVNESLQATVGPQLFVDSLLKAYENYLLVGVKLMKIICW